MDYYTLSDIAQLNNVVIIHKKSVSTNKITNLLYNIHNSAKIQFWIKLPFKKIWDKLLFNKLLMSFSPDYIIITVPWYSDHLYKYFRKYSPSSKIILRFTDTVNNELCQKYSPQITDIKGKFDGVLVYSEEDAIQYGYKYHSVGYSPIMINKLERKKQYDVVFIGAEKGRIDKIRQAYNIFISAGLTCFFYVILVKEEDRRNDGIIYGEKVMPFYEYLLYESSAKCLFEIIQDGTTGRTYRMMESIVYNKMLITNCPEITYTDYNNPKYVQIYKDVAEIDPSFITNCHETVDYQYKGDFSPMRVLDFIADSF